MTATLSLTSVLRESALRHPDKVGVVDGDNRVTYAELWQRSLRYAAALRELCPGPRPTVALLAPNTVEFPTTYYGALAAGCVVVPVHLLFTAPEMAHVLRDSGADLLVCHHALAAVGAAASAEAGVPLVTVGGAPSGGDAGIPADGAADGSTPVPSLDQLADTTTPLPVAETTAPEDPAVVLYTSGTTGEPKGAVLTHLNLVMNATISAFDANEVRHADVVLGCLPLFHTFGQTVSMNACFRAGGTLVLLARFHPDTAIDLMLREDVDVFHGVPTMYVALLAAASRHDRLPALRLCVSGGAALPVPVLEGFSTTFDAQIYEGYGLSETSPVATASQPRFGTRAGTVGHAIWGVEVEIAELEDPERIRLLGEGELGEIVVRGHNVFAGYLNRPQATEQVVVDGWFRTGDLGTKDADGFVRVVDRKGDVVIRGGYNIYPREVEDVLARHPSVRQVAVIGLPDPVYGEEVCAVVVAEEGGEPVTEETLVSWSRPLLGKHKYPRHVRFVDELPLGPSHKVLKRELRRRLAAQPGAEAG
ncbi:long-chain fatty acid--CoA ligase [Actinoalloteichus sp. AHMU CJ021]|uniref:long-chain-fatty-acid--CoA ligase n=1 Tax=Actinoalloteichus sp. AHMU CJ021 TaxID=2072503 RepID=UPI000CA02B21|nr:long-chain fatty acid--CoA ligase [Actinoalloteichus sp. AHMU CJ021]